MCAMLLWATRSQRIDPFIVSVDDLTGQWTVVGHSHKNGPIEYPVLWSVQQSVVGNFVANWFTISADQSENEAMWQTCERKKDCGLESVRSYDDNTCALFCVAGQELFSSFIYDVIPDYQLRASNGETWSINKADINIEPAGKVKDVGGTWRISGKIYSNVSEDMKFIAFVKVARNVSSYPKTLGYYVADFNAYKVDR